MVSQLIHSSAFHFSSAGYFWNTAGIQVHKCFCLFIPLFSQGVALQQQNTDPQKNGGIFHAQESRHSLYERVVLLKLFRLHFLFDMVWTYMIDMQFLEIVGVWHFLTAISGYILWYFWLRPGLHYHLLPGFACLWSEDLPPGLPEHEAAAPNRWSHEIHQEHLTGESYLNPLKVTIGSFSSRS